MLQIYTVKCKNESIINDSYVKEVDKNIKQHIKWQESTLVLASEKLK